MPKVDLKKLAAAAAAVAALAQAPAGGLHQLTFDPAFPESRPTEHQWGFFNDIGRLQYRIARGGNQSSKSSTTTREMSWVFTATHPKWKRPSSTQCPCCDAKPILIGGADYRCVTGHEWRDWGAGPLLGIVAGQSKTAMEEELWKNKMRPFFGPEWKERHRGGYLSSVRNEKTGDRIIFLSHADSSEQNRKYLQTFVAHYVLLDEMPTSMGIFEELMRRTDSRCGYFVAGFTPKVYSGAVKRWVDSLEEPTGKVYRFSKFQNPLFAGREEEERAKLKGLPQAAIDCILFGDWMPGDGLVFWFEEKLHGCARRPDYSERWPHVLVVDPATESKLGLFLAYHVPETAPVLAGPYPPPGGWVCRRSVYVEGVYTPTKIVDEVESSVVEFNLVERVSDPAATWFIRQAADMPDDAKLSPAVRGRSIFYTGVPGKNIDGRKNEMLVESQAALGSKLWIESTPDTSFLIDELGTMARSPDTNQIRKAKRFHLVDCLNYFVDRLPFALPLPQSTDLDEQQQLYARWREAGGAAAGDPPPAIERVVAAERELARFRTAVRLTLSRAALRARRRL